MRQVDKLKIGDHIEAEIEIRGRQYKRRDGSKAIYTTLKCIGLQLLDRIDTSNTGYKPKPGSHDERVDGRQDQELPLK